MSNGKRQRVLIALLVVCLAVIATVGYQLWSGVQEARRQIAFYEFQVSTPTEPNVCPGDVIQFEQRIRVETTGAVNISRDWCVAGGVCSLELHQQWQQVILTQMMFEGMVTRTVPVSPFFRAGGRYEMRSGIINGRLDVLIVPFTIRDDCK